MLTNSAVRAARPRAAGYKLADAGGLHLFVAPNGRRSFRLRFRWEGREQLLSFGTWPEVSLEAARDRAAAAREQLCRGEDPRLAARAVGQALDFEQLARRWHAHMLPRWTPVHAADVLVSLERDVFPMLGSLPIGGITPPAVLATLRAIERRGRRETARRVRQRISGVFKHAIAEGLADRDPAALVGDALMPPAPQRRQPALVEIAEARALLAAVDALGGASAARLASRFLALTAVRLAAVRGARWGEIEDLDGDAPTWRVPAARMKLAAAKKLDPANDHLVPLSRQAVELLRAARENGYDTHSPDALVFPGRRKSLPIGEAAIGTLYDRAGFAGRHVPHGWRATFSTILNERFPEQRGAGARARAPAGGGREGPHGWRATFSTILNERFPEQRGAIDRALAHAGGGKDEKDEGINRKVEGAYNRATHLPRRRQLFQAWSDALDGA